MDEELEYQGRCRGCQWYSKEWGDDRVTKKEMQEVIDDHQKSILKFRKRLKAWENMWYVIWVDSGGEVISLPLLKHRVAQIVADNLKNHYQSVKIVRAALDYEFIDNVKDDPAWNVPFDITSFTGSNDGAKAISVKVEGMKLVPCEKYTARIDPDNVASRKCFKRAGFERVGGEYSIHWIKT